MKARMDMGEALRNTTLVSRPSDMFFLPSAGAPEAQQAADSAAAPSGTTESEAEARSTVSRETPSPETTRPSADDVEAPPEGHPDGMTAPEQQHLEVVVTGSAAVGDAAKPTDDSRVEEATEPPQTSRATDHSAPDASADDVSRGTDADVEELAAVPGATFAEIPVAAIHPNRKQPRQVFDEEELAELAYSIGELGVLQPIVVRPTREDGEQAYELVMGERRWRATQRAGLPTIPAIVRETADDDLLRDALLENLHRSQLNPLEEAAAYQQLLEEFGATQEELSRRIGRSRPQISNTIRLLRLPPLVQRRVAAGVLSSGHARALLSLADPAQMERLAQRIVAEGLSVRATEEAVQLTETGERKPQRAAAPAGRNKERLDYIAEAFSDRLDTSVRIALGARKGKMTIEFASVEDLNRIIEVLDPGMDRG
ncbi:ParB/RepB/Spo0J family partition protein [Kocuria rosea]|uniref:ParB/RepB/Spo0J family partition protein n=1 Tax=Kocuria rosea TaxID=1275 RepID=UPI00253FA60B|nr:ParB/RepB/Spo0J family partition protein [Kocuria rosea]WIG17343.1 ParB/RepB/Spo0J family partition protein [Kocuria rosea]